MDHDPYFDPPPSGVDHTRGGAPAAPKLDVDTRDILPDMSVGNKRGRSLPRSDLFDRGVEMQDRSPRRRRFDGPPPGFDQRYDGGGGRFGGGGRGGGRGRRDRNDDAPLSFREFCLRHVSDSASPAEAEQKYENYRKEHADSFRRWDFERPGGIRDDPKIRAAHDPRAIEEAIVQRAELAQEQAKLFAEEVGAGTLPALPVAKQVEQSVNANEDADGENPEKPNEEDTAMDTEQTTKPNARQKKDSRGRWPVPDAAWAPTRLARDLRACEGLIETLNAEKSIAMSTAELFGDADTVAPALTAADPIPPLSRRDRKPGEDGEDEAAHAETAGDGTGGVDQTTLASTVDTRVSFLWRVHGLDYYAGLELRVDEYVVLPPYNRNNETGEGCLTRGPCPDDDVLQTETKAYLAEVTGSKKDEPEPAGDDSRNAKERKPFGFNTVTAKWALRVDRCWHARVEEGDKATVVRCGADRVERELEEWKQSCVVRHEENRFGCTLSSKMFIAVEFVMKHINVKQAPAVEHQQNQILDAIYLENYLSACKEDERSSRREKRLERKEKRGGDGGRGKGARQEMRALAKSIVKDGPTGVAKTGSTNAPKPVSKSYNDLDAPKVDRVVLDYGDI